MREWPIKKCWSSSDADSTGTGVLNCILMLFDIFESFLAQSLIYCPASACKASNTMQSISSLIGAREIMQCSQCSCLVLLVSKETSGAIWLMGATTTPTLLLRLTDLTSDVTFHFYHENSPKLDKTTENFPV